MLIVSDFFKGSITNLMLFYGLNFHFLFQLLTLTEMIVIKTLYMFCYSRIADLNEFLVSRIALVFNITIILLNMIIRIASKEYENNEFYVHLQKAMQDKINDESSSTRINLTW